MKNFSFKKKFTGIVSGIGFRSLNVICLLFLTPLQLSIFGFENYGIFILLLSLFGFGGLLELGLSQAAVKHYSRSNSTTPDKIYTISFMFFLLGIISFLLVAFIGTLFLSIFENYSIKPYHIFLLAVSISLKIISQKFNAQLTAEEFFHKVNLSNFSGFLIRQLVPLFFAAGLTFNFYDSAFFSILLAAAIQLIISYLYAVNNKKIRSKKQLNWKFLKRVCKESFFLFFTQLSGEVALHGDKFIIASILGPSSLAAYHVAYIVIARVNDIGFLLNSVYFPELCHHGSEKQIGAMKRLARICLVLSFSFGTILVTTYWYIGELFLTYWITSLPPSSYQISLILMAGAYFGLGSWTFSNILVALEGEATVSVTIMINTIFSMTLCFFLVKNFGIFGAAGSWSLSYIILSIMLGILARKKLAINSYGTKSYL